jgi:hypothetical protein
MAPSQASYKTSDHLGVQLSPKFSKAPGCQLDRFFKLLPAANRCCTCKKIPTSHASEHHAVARMMSNTRAVLIMAPPSVTGSRPDSVEKWTDKGDPVIEYLLYPTKLHAAIMHSTRALLFLFDRLGQEMSAQVSTYPNMSKIV